jgi:hypothetical protein
MLKSRRPCRDWIHGNTESWGRNPELNHRSPRARRGSAAIRRVRLPPVAIGSPKLRRIRPKAGAPGRTRTIDPLSGRSLRRPGKNGNFGCRTARTRQTARSVPCFSSLFSESPATTLRETFYADQSHPQRADDPAIPLCDRSCEVLHSGLRALHRSSSDRQRGERGEAKMANPIVLFPVPQPQKEDEPGRDSLTGAPELRLIEGGETELEAKRRRSEERLARRRRRRQRTQCAAARVPSKSPFGLW